MTVTHELHEAIHRRFAAEGIEIPFPQQDLHVRTVDPALQLVTSEPSPQDLQQQKSELGMHGEIHATIPARRSHQA